MAGGFVEPGRSVSERRSREGLGKDNGRTNVNLLLKKRERDWTELTFTKISGILTTVTRDGTEMGIYIGGHDGDDNEKVKKAMGSIGKTTTLHVHHAFLCISLPALYVYEVKAHNFTFYDGESFFLVLDLNIYGP